MNTKRYLLETATLIIAAALCAIVSNAMAARERKLALPGNYPNATSVPSRSDEPLTPLGASGTVTETSTAIATLPSRTSTAPFAPVVAPPPLVSTAPVTATTAPVTATTATVAPPPRRTADISKFKPHPDKAYVEIPGDDVAALHAAGALFLDARRSSVYQQGHIAGARSFSVWESDVDEKVNRLYEERSTPEEQDKPIVIYCSGGDCEDSHMLAQKLWGLQFNNVYVYKDGFPDWQKRGGAARTGDAP